MQSAYVLSDYKFQNSTYYANGCARRYLSELFPIYSFCCCYFQCFTCTLYICNLYTYVLPPVANIGSDAFHGSFTFIFSIFTNPRKQTFWANNKVLDRISFSCLAYYIYEHLLYVIRRVYI